MRSTLILVPVLLLALATPALASDGVLEINQTCAVQTGCFGGDTAEFPVTISTLGSYRLTGNLVVPNENTTAIAVSTSNVSIDLNGFGIIRSGCEESTSACVTIYPDPCGSGIGIAVNSPVNKGVSIRDGTITGMGSGGVALGDNAEVRNLRVRANCSIGISAGTDSVVLESNLSYNGNGIRLGEGSIVSDSVVSTSRASTGIEVGANSVVSRNSILRNQGRGLLAGSNSTIIGNSLNGNGDGILAGDVCTISENTLYDNNQAGVTTGFGSTVQRNSIWSCITTCLSLGAGSGYGDNTFSGTTVSGGINTGGNVCAGSLCP